MADSQDSLDGEIWKPVPGWEGLYEASSFGRVRRLPGFVRGRGKYMRPISGGIRKTPISSRAGYRNVMLCGGNGRNQTIMLHIVICATFHGPKPSERHQVAHSDGNPQNNNASNLRWATALENADDRERHGKTCRGPNSGTAKLTANVIADIRRAYAADNRSSGRIAAAFGITRTQVYNIVHRKQWAHI